MMFSNCGTRVVTAMAMVPQVSIRFDSHDGFMSMTMTLARKDGLYYCPTDMYTVHDAPAIWCSPMVCCIATRVNSAMSNASLPHWVRLRFIPTTKAKQMESEVWLLRLGLPGVWQLDVLLGRVKGIPSEF